MVIAEKKYLLIKIPPQVQNFHSTGPYATSIIIVVTEPSNFEINNVICQYEKSRTSRRMVQKPGGHELLPSFSEIGNF